MSSNYQLSIRLNSIFNFPVTPEEIKVSYGSNNSNLRVYGVGECTIIQDSDAANISFSGFFPKMYFSGCNYRDIPNPNTAVEEVLAMKNTKKPVRFTILTGRCGCLCMPQSRNLQPRKSAGIPERYIMTSLSRSTGKLPCGR